MKGLGGGISLKASAVIKSQNQVKQVIRSTSEFRHKTEMKASKTLFADKLREEEKAAKKSAKIEQAIRSRKVDVGIASTGFTRLKAPQIAQMRSQFESLNSSLRRGSISMADYRKSTQQLMVTFRGANRSIRTLNERFLNLRHNMLGLGAVGAVGAGGASIVRTGQDFEGMGAKMLIATGSSEKAAEGMALARKESLRLGLDLMSTTDSFARLGIAARDKLSEKDFESLFTSFSELGTAAQLPKEQMDRGLRALEQMLNKGQLMAEEVKGQFSEAIPGGIRIFADALGVGEQEFFKMMESGSLLAADVLPKVAEQMASVARRGGALETAIKSNRAAMGRMTTMFQEFKVALFAAGLDELTRGIFQTATNLMFALKPIAVFFTSTLATAIKVASFPIRLIIALMADLTEMFKFELPEGFSESGSKAVGFAAGLLFLWKGASLVRKMFKFITGPIGKFAGMLGTATATTAIGSKVLIGLGSALGFVGRNIFTLSRFLGPVGLLITGLTVIMRVFDDEINSIIDGFLRFTGLKEGFNFGGGVDEMTKNAMMKSIQTTAAKRGQTTQQSLGVEITFKGDKADEFFEAKIKNNEQRMVNDILANSVR
jgi:tape measure domain-containing protein